MRYLYLIAGSVIALAGVAYIADTFIQVGSMMEEIGVIAGLLFVYLGILNILNYWYGSKARGVWIAAIGANVAMLALIWIIGAHPQGLEWGLMGALAIAALMSLDPRNARPA